MARLMVLDDDPYVRELVSKVAYRLVGTAVEVLAATDLGEAQAILSAGPVELILTDMVMPELDGPEVVRRLRALFPGLRSIVMTGDAGQAGRSIPESLVPVRDKANLEAIVEEAVYAALETL